MSTKKKLIQETIETSFDHDTGEVKQESNVRTFQIPQEPPFVKLYIEDLTSLYDLPKTSPSMLMELLKKLDYEGQVNLNAANKRQICERTGHAIKTLDNFLSQLVKHKIFRRIDRGVFVPNPHLFGRGEWREIHKRREAWLKVTYDENGERQVTSSLEE
ncbi:replication/maintenance protein RepL [Photobacterium leiognathi]|uniref:replication/maintenance protein RepL n=1 Tax=Photobacterium leiognathi TaxID=553611 RepID=UPI0029823049|nr:replication/maintenance protein RepL [Photobacterium leiognathi]